MSEPTKQEITRHEKEGWTNAVHERARAAALDHGEWLEADHYETNYDAFVAGYLAAAEREHVERIAELEKLLAVQIEVRKMSDALADEHLIAREAAERERDEAYAWIASWCAMQPWQIVEECKKNAPAVRRALGREAK